MGILFTLVVQNVVLDRGDQARMAEITRCIEDALSEHLDLVELAPEALTASLRPHSHREAFRAECEASYPSGGQAEAAAARLRPPSGLAQAVADRARQGLAPQRPAAPPVAVSAPLQLRVVPTGLVERLYSDREGREQRREELVRKEVDKFQQKPSFMNDISRSLAKDVWSRDKLYMQSDAEKPQVQSPSSRSAYGPLPSDRKPFTTATPAEGKVLPRGGGRAQDGFGPAPLLNAPPGKSVRKSDGAAAKAGRSSEEQAKALEEFFERQDKLLEKQRAQRPDQEPVPRETRRFDTSPRPTRSTPVLEQARGFGPLQLLSFRPDDSSQPLSPLGTKSAELLREMGQDGKNFLARQERSIARHHDIHRPNKPEPPEAPDPECTWAPKIITRAPRGGSDKAGTPQPPGQPLRQPGADGEDDPLREPGADGGRGPPRQPGAEGRQPGAEGRAAHAGGLALSGARAVPSESDWDARASQAVLEFPDNGAERTSCGQGPPAKSLAELLSTGSQYSQHALRLASMESRYAVEERRAGAPQGAVRRAVRGRPELCGERPRVAPLAALRGRPDVAAAVRGARGPGRGGGARAARGRGTAPAGRASADPDQGVGRSDLGAARAGSHAAEGGWSWRGPAAAGLGKPLCHANPGVGGVGGNVLGERGSHGSVACAPAECIAGRRGTPGHAAQVGRGRPAHGRGAG
ncbi:unnamed protein product, partial [Prorocentrum cordatum]